MEEPFRFPGLDPDQVRVGDQVLNLQDPADQKKIVLFTNRCEPELAELLLSRLQQLMPCEKCGRIKPTEKRVRSTSGALTHMKCINEEAKEMGLRQRQLQGA